MASEGVVTPDAKQHFDDIYVMKNPVGFKTRIMDELSYVCDNFTRQEFDRLLLPELQRISKARGDTVPLRVVDLLACYGNTTMACVNGMTTEEIKENWKDDEACEKVSTKRRFNSSVTGVDISKQAMAYGMRTGIFDNSLCADLNSHDGHKTVAPIMNSADLLISTAALVYLTPEAVEHLVLAFAQGEGEGYAIVNFLNPFEPEKTDAMKRILLKHLDFVGSRAARHRKMSDKEQKNYADYGDWALLEIWTLRRRNRAPTSMPVKSPETQADLTAQKLLETDAKPCATSRALSYRPVPKAGAIKQALVTAASRLSSLDSQSGPKCLIRLGDLPVICHVISQLSHSGIERAVILCGYQGKQIQQAVERNLSSQFREKN